MIRIALVGAGTMGEAYCKAFQEFDRSEMAAVCDLDLKRARRVAKAFGVPSWYGDCADMLAKEEIDAVVVATPDAHHRGPVLTALKAGKHVLCEKPLATARRDCTAIAAAAKESGTKFMVNFGNRHRPNARIIRERVRSGEIGTVRNVFVHLRETLKKTHTLSWVADTTPTFFLLSHCIDTVRWIVGGMAKETYAKASYGVLKKRGLNTPDTVVAVLTFGHGTVATMDASWVMPDGFAPDIDFRLELIGDKGAIYADLYPRDLLQYGKVARGLDHSSGPLDPFGRTLSWWVNSCRYFVECIEKNRKPEPTVDDGVAVTRILLSIEEACRRGGVVKVR